MLMLLNYLILAICGGITGNVPRLGAVAATWNDYFLVKLDFPAENRT